MANLQPNSATVSKSAALLGEVHQDGTIRYHSTEIDNCRTFLRKLGLEVDLYGWEGNGMRGLLEFRQDEWHCAAWEANYG